MGRFRPFVRRGICATYVKTRKQAAPAEGEASEPEDGGANSPGLFERVREKVVNSSFLRLLFSPMAVPPTLVFPRGAAPCR